MTEPISVIISALIAALISILTGVYTVKQSEKRFYAENSVKDRKPWVDDMRAFLVELLTIAALNESESALSKEDRERFERARQNLLIRLNPLGKGYERDEELFKLLSLDFNGIKGNADKIRQSLSGIIKHERDKLRIETGRSKRMRQKIVKEQRSQK